MSIVHGFLRNFVIVGFIGLLIHECCYCDEHVYGEPKSGGKLLFEKVLFSKNLPKPQNYTLIFKYIGSELSPNITYARFNVQNTTSFAALELSLEKDKERTLQATINIVNGTRIHVTAAVHGPSVSVLDAGSVQRFALLRNQAVPKTMTIVYGHNATKTRNRKVILGQRQPGDKLIDFQTKNVTLSFRFAETEFEYHDKQKHITSVGFSFNSPSAIAFINSSFVGEHGLNAIAYDLNSLWFLANMSVYGFDNFDKPPQYTPIVLSNKIKL